MRCFLSLLLFPFLLFSQTQDALVFFADKPNVQQALSNPISILSQEALDRKALHNVAIDERDVPIDESYITQLKNQPGISVFAKSKWMNAVYVRGTLSQIQNLINLSFVSGIEFMDKSLNFAPFQNTTVTDKFEIETTSKNLNYGEAANQIEMLSGEVLHAAGYTGNGMRIAVLDSGFPNVDILGAFSALINENRLLGTYDFVNRSETIISLSSHGTRVLSTMAAYIENIFIGTAPDASYYLFRTEDSSTENPVEEAYWVEAVERADSLGVHVVNTSLGYRAYDDESYSHQYEDLDGQTTIAARGANTAFEKGLMLVTSAGNSGNGDFPWVGTPADAPNMLSIGAVDEFGDYGWFSSIGPTVDGRIKPDIMAQGVEAANILQDGTLSASNGTSFSSPITAGLVACLWQARPEVTNAQLLQIIRESAHLFDEPTDLMGYGIPDFAVALNNILDVEHYQLPEISVYPNPVAEVLSIVIENISTSIQLEVYTILGVKVMQTELNSSENTVSFSSLNSGMYLLQFTTEDTKQTLKVIKK
ncbi:MAG TPA: S8 family serine peptidase [Flavobacteriaceae bacterium]|nr:S8 family serine peptidase [Flavobacteriaceae bacterium]